MTVILNSGSSVALVTGTETTLTQIGTPGRFQLIADLVNFQNGDAIEFRVKSMVSPGGTVRPVEEMIFYGLQFPDDIVKESAIHNNDQTDAQSLVFTATQIAGTSRTLIWKVVQVDAEPSNFLNMTIDPQGRVAVGQVTVSGSLPSPQRFDLIGNITGSIQGNITTVITGAAANIDYSQVWSFTGTRSLNGVQTWDLHGDYSGTMQVRQLKVTAPAGLDALSLYASGSFAHPFYAQQVGGNQGAMYLTSDTAPGLQIAGGLNAAAVDIRSSLGQAGLFVLGHPGMDIESTDTHAIYLFAGQASGSAIRLQQGNIDGGNFNGNISGAHHYGSWHGNLLGYVGQVTGSAMSLVSGAQASIDYSQVWSFTGARTLNGLQTFDISGTITNVFNVRNQVLASGVVNPVVASAVQGGQVTVSGTVIADVRSLVGVSGTVNLTNPQVVNIIGNVSGTVTNNYNLLQEVEDLVALGLLDERAVMGNIYYVDGSRGNDISGDGTRTFPFKTITRALIPVVSHNHDAIFLLPVPTGTNTITETGTVTINKADVSVWGPGYDVLVTNIPANNRDVFNITAEGVSLRQFRLTATGNSANGVVFSGGAALGLLSHLWIESVPQDGVSINVGNRNRIEFTHIQTVGRDGVRINSGAGSGTYNVIEDSIIRNNVGNGINLLGVDASNNRIRRNVIRDNIGFGISISAGTSATQIADNRIFNNTAGPINDLGTNTYQQWNFFNTDTVGIPLAVYNLVSGSALADKVWQYTGTRTIDYLRSLVGVSGTVIASVVQGGQVLVSGTVVASAVQSLVGVSGTVVASAVQGGFVTVSGAVALQPNQIVIASAVQGGYVTVSGAVDAVRGGYVTVSGTVVVGTNNDKTGYFLGTPQRFDLIGNITGSIQGNIVNVITGAAPNIDYSQIWNYTGSKVVDAVKGGYVNASGIVVNVTGVTASVDYAAIWNFTGSRTVNAVQGGFVTVSGTVVASAIQGGYVTVSGTVVASSGTINTVYNLVSGAATPIDYSQVWLYTGSKIVDAVKGGYVNASGVSVNIDYSQIWNYTGTRTVDAVKGGYVTVSGTVVASAVQGGYVNASGIVVSVTGVTATVDPTSIWNYQTRTLTNQVFNLPPVSQGNTLNIIRGDTFSWSPTNLGSLANLSKLFFTIKRIYADLDSEAEIQVEKSAGLVYINRAPAANPAHGSIVVNDVNLGNITIVVDAVETAKLDLLMDVYYDVQFINTSGTVTTLVSGPVTIAGDATRSTS